MALSAGSRLGAYEVLAQLGAGGMGEVYRAKDTKLGREVALKILPVTFTNDPERLARFRREAQILAALNHPHIGVIYGLDESDGTQFLVLELVDGESLDTRIARGKIPIDEALAIAKQIAAALEAAHEKGIIHRDLKPANIALTRDGNVKVLDFGLAKATENAAASALDVTNSPTITTPAMMTGVGIILGTAAYMSPEQAKGRPADKRSDVWAFGCVLFEMVTGKRAFDGEDLSETLASVLRAEPVWSAIPAEAPDIHELLEGCLHKDRSERIADLSTVRFLLNHRSRRVETPGDGRRKSLSRAALAATALVVVAAGSGWIASRRASPDGRVVTRFAIEVPDFAPAAQPLIALSPDGRRLALVSNQRLYIRGLDRLDVASLAGTEGAVAPFFSPDGRWVAFWQAGVLKKVSVTGGMPVAICDIPLGPLGAALLGPTWGADDQIVFGRGGTELSRVSAAGGTPERLLTLDKGETAYGPQMLPDGRTVLFTVNPAGLLDRAQIVVQQLDSGRRDVVVSSGRDARYLPSGLLLFARGTTIMVAPFDSAKRQLTGTPRPIVEGVRAAPTLSTALSHFSVSANGTFAYVPASTSTERRMLVWVDRQGREEPLPADARPYGYPRISPDGKRVAVHSNDRDDDIWIWDIARATLARFTATPENEQSPVWSPDGRFVFFQSTRGGAANIYRQAVEGTYAAERVTTGTLRQLPDAVTPDGKMLVFRELDASANYDLRVVSIDGQRESQPLLATRFNEQNADLSPDGHWIVYQSDESGQAEVYVRPFPRIDDGRWIVSTGGGHRPMWARTGREVFYRSATGAMMSVAVQLQPQLSIGAVTKLFDGPDYLGARPDFGSGNPARHYDATPDGSRFLMVKQPPNVRDTATARVIVIENWFEELKERIK